VVEAQGPEVIFVGPSLPHDEVIALRPGATVLGPAALGDVISVTRQLEPRAIVLIDGVFHSQMSVFHKELLFSLDHGCWVIGAASIGALRAAECASFGVIGVGEIFARYSSGELVDDDEVALSHGDAESGYAHLSDAFVTIRAALLELVQRGKIDDAEHDALLELQRARWFPDRHLASITHDLAGLGAPPDRVAAVDSALRAGFEDPKSADARAAIAALVSLPGGPFPEDRRPRTVMTSVFRAALTRETKIAGSATRVDDVRRRAALHDVDHQDLVLAARSKLALRTISSWIGGPASPGELEAARMVVARRLGTDLDGLSSRARELDMDDYVLRTLIEREAHVHRMASSWLTSTSHSANGAAILDEMRLTGAYEIHRSRAIFEGEVTADVEFEPPLSSGSVLAAFCALTGRDFGGNVDSIASDLELGSSAEVIEAMLVTVKAAWVLFGLRPDAELRTGSEVEEAPLMSRGR
jgi:hypothetical protein